MVYGSIIGLWATVWMLPPAVSLMCLACCGCVSGLAFGVRHVWAGRTGMAEICTTVLSTTMLGLCVMLVLYVNLMRRLEDNFESLPWKRRSAEGSHPAAICPFTGHTP